MTRENSGKTLYLVDGTAQLYRAYYAIRDLTNAEGLPTNAVYGFTTMLRKLIREERPAFLGVAFDVRGPVFRHETFSEYKANRPPAPQDLNTQVPYAKQVCEALGIPALELQGFEADDLIATYTVQAREAGLEVVIVASDKDLMQLVGHGVTMLNPTTNTMLDASGVEKSFGVPPERVRDVLGLMGDSVDNVPGVPGVGRKSALAIVADYGGLDAVVERAACFAAAYSGRDRLLEAIDAAAGEDELQPATGRALDAAISDLVEKFSGLLGVERDPEMSERFSATVRTLNDHSGKPAEAVGQPGRRAVYYKDSDSASRGSNLSTPGNIKNRTGKEVQ